MRTDVKVGLICVFAIILGVVIYFVAKGNNNPQPSYGGTIGTPTATVTPATAPAAAAPTVSTLDVAPVGTAIAQTPTGGPGNSISGSVIAPPSPSTPIIPTTTTAPATTIPTFGGPSSPALGGGVPMGTTSMIPPAGTQPSHSTLSGTGSGTGRGTIEIDSGRSTSGSGLGNSSSFGSGSSSFGSGSSSFGSGSSTFGGSTTGGGLTGSATTYTIQKGDMFGTIAKKYNVTIKALEAANPGVDSSHLTIGKSINIPAPTAAGSSLGTIGTTTHPATTRPGHSAVVTTRPAGSTIAAKPGSSYTIKKGDTLSKIAIAVYGDKGAWQKIFRANRGDIADPNSVAVGTVIKLPAN